MIVAKNGTKLKFEVLIKLMAAAEIWCDINVGWLQKFNEGVFSYIEGGL